MPTFFEFTGPGVEDPSSLNTNVGSTHVIARQFGGSKKKKGHIRSRGTSRSRRRSTRKCKCCSTRKSVKKKSHKTLLQKKHRHKSLRQKKRRSMKRPYMY